MRAIVAQEKGRPAELVQVPAPTPGPGEVQIAVAYSSLNYKDGATVMGRPGFVRSYPLTVGIDAVGTVIATGEGVEEPAPGTLVVLNGAGAGESRPGGFAEVTTAAAESVVPVPESLTAEQAAVIGTAGFTAALAVMAIEDHGLAPGDGEVLVTGAAGGVGSVAISLLATRGYTVVASTGRADSEGAYLRSLGAARVIDRAELSDGPEAPLASQRWAAVVDGVGSSTLAAALAATRYGGIAVAYGLAQGMDLPTTVLPFILRAVTLTGANSVDAPQDVRRRAWELLGAELDQEALAAMTRGIGLAEVPAEAEAILEGAVRGRTVVDVHA